MHTLSQANLIFYLQAILLSSLQHPNIVSYKDSWIDDSGVLHIIMGYCEGGDLCSRLKTYKDHLLPEARVVEWFVQISLGLQYLHDHNILHRDLKVSVNHVHVSASMNLVSSDTEHFFEQK